ncbi:SIMPL domain-containing protein [Microaerobacter geothermalis]|uniref:SIMPL domain-containing protein n=1 Tax=Microaerobacter geothermalis TaxID=674972 RepID=UPI001F27B763|nr:SIMPL domain-containing protein [Microaerobacter geothermalis]MCF6094580.1 SIMPL domain-containing protein [Microaerobacter geothermalis]
MKGIVKKLGFVVVAIGLVAGLSIYSPLGGLGSDQPTYAEEIQTNVIQVQGKGKLTVVPDIAMVNLGVMTEDRDASVAIQQNSKIFEDVRRAILSLGIKDKDIKTVSFTTYPQYNWKENQQELRGYQVNHMIQVTLRNTKDIGKVLDAASKAGANRVENIRYTTDKTDEYEKEVLKLALKNAREKADVIAAAIGKQITDVAKVTQLGVPYYPDYYSNYSMEVAAKAGYAADTVITPGEITIETTVDVTFRY